MKFLRLQFTDILGTIKNVEIPDRQFEDALDGKITFDGSSIEGFVRIEESDMYLRPDLSTFRVFPWPGTTGERQRRPAAPRHRSARAMQRAIYLGHHVAAQGGAVDPRQCAVGRQGQRLA